MIDVLDHRGLALKLARRRWRMHGVLPRDDYEQEAMLALVIAAGKFSDDRGARFSTFAWRCIDGALINAERSWVSWSRRTGTGPMFVEIEDDDAVSLGMTEADVASLVGLFEGEWFARPARLVLISGLSTLDAARLCNCRLNTVHQAVSYYRSRLRQLAA